MKYLLLLLLLGGFFLVLGARRGRPREPESRTPAPPPAPQAMSSCAECGVHLPADEALPGKGGAFCSAAHRASYEARQGPA